MSNDLKEVLSKAFTEYRQAYRSDETAEKMLFPRDNYPDIISYQAAKIMEVFEIKIRKPNSPKPRENK